MAVKRDIARKRADKRPSRRRLYLYPLLGSSAITLLLFTSAFFLPVREMESESEKRENQSNLMPITALANPNTLTYGDETLANIYAWVDLKSSERTEALHSPLQFSAYIGSPQAYHYAGFGQHTVQERSYFSDKMAGSPPAEKLSANRNSMPLPWKPQIVLPEPEEIPFTPPKGIFWLNEDGLMVSNPPYMDKEQVLEILGKHEGILSTKLEYRHLEMPWHPRVVIRQSCGLPELDRLAVNALRVHLNHFARERQFSDQQGILPNGLLTVLWHLL